jgi:hypothetical protein
VTDPGYLTTVPGTRGAAFYDTASADPDVIAYDEAHKDVMAADEAGDAATHAEGVRASEAAYYTSARA